MNMWRLRSGDEVKMKGRSREGGLCHLEGNGGGGEGGSSWKSEGGGGGFTCYSLV